jgi:hypothetical protein
VHITTSNPKQTSTMAGAGAEGAAWQVSGSCMQEWQVPQVVSNKVMRWHHVQWVSAACNRCLLPLADGGEIPQVAMQLPSKVICVPTVLVHCRKFAQWYTSSNDLRHPP